MNILIVGNGFDLAHGLPTKYADFLKFIDFFYKHKAQESSGLELIAGEDTIAISILQTYLTVNKILNLISIYMINQEKQFMS